LAATTEGFEDIASHADAFIDAGGAVLVEARRSGKGVASGVEVEERQYHVWDMQDGQAVRFRLFLVKADALAALA
jgi:ketosteroid isomerase-like protein